MFTPLYGKYKSKCSFMKNLNFRQVGYTCKTPRSQRGVLWGPMYVGQY